MTIYGSPKLPKRSMGIRGDLIGQTLALDSSATPRLQPDEVAFVLVEAIHVGTDESHVSVTGRWTLPDGVVRVSVEVHKDALPAPRGPK
jgi:hypothetical protein